MKNLGTITHKKSDEIDGSAWGIHYCEYPERGYEFSVEKMVQSGAKWVRYYYDTVWSCIEKQTGRYTYDVQDKVIQAFLEKGITPIVFIGGGNFLYTEGLVGYHPFSRPGAKEAFLKYVENMVEHYKDKIFYWEVWNEVNHKNFWKTGPNAEEYGRLLSDVSDIIRKHQGDKAKIIAASLAGIDINYAEQLMRTCARGKFDILSVHPYNYMPEDTIESINSLRKTVQKYDEKLVFWNGECGYPSSGDTIHGRPLAPWGHKIQAKWLLRRSLCDLLSGLEVSIYFILLENHYTRKMYDNKEVQVAEERPVSHFVGSNTKGLIRYSDGSDKLAFKALKNLTSLISSEYTLSQKNTGFTITSEGVFYGAGKSDREYLNPYSLTFSSTKGNMFVYWLPWPLQENIEQGTVDIDIHDIKFANPVLIDLLDGNVYDIPMEKKADMVSFKDLCLTDYPLAIVEKDLIQIV